MYVKNQSHIVSDKGVTLVNDIRTDEGNTSGAFLVNVKRSDEYTFRVTLIDYEEATRSAKLDLAVEIAQNTLRAELEELLKSDGLVEPSIH